MLWRGRKREGGAAMRAEGSGPTSDAQVSIGLSDGSSGPVDEALREELLATAEAVVGDERALAKLRARRRAARWDTPPPT